jgi:hypothetical protein
MEDEDLMWLLIAALLLVAAIAVAVAFGAM